MHRPFWNRLIITDRRARWLADLIWQGNVDDERRRKMRRILRWQRGKGKGEANGKSALKQWKWRNLSSSTHCTHSTMADQCWKWLNKEVDVYGKRCRGNCEIMSVPWFNSWATDSYTSLLFSSLPFSSLLFSSLSLLFPSLSLLFSSLPFASLLFLFSSKSNIAR